MGVFTSLGSFLYSPTSKVMGGTRGLGLSSSSMRTDLWRGESESEDSDAHADTCQRKRSSYRSKMDQLLGDIGDASKRQKVAESIEQFMVRQAELASSKTLNEGKA